MRKGLHPLVHWIDVITVRGGSFRVPMTVRQARNQLFLQVDSSTHPAWTGKKADTSNTGQLAKFNARFDMMREDEEAEAAPAAPAAGEKAPKRR